MTQNFAGGNGENERRLIGYRSNMERFVETTKDYGDWSLDKPLAPVAGAVHLFTQGFGLDPVIKDVGRAADSNTSDLRAYAGIFPRIRENTREIVSDVFHLKPFSAITKAINYVGDGTADLADLVANVDHGGGTRSQMKQVMNKSEKHYAQTA